MRARPQLLALVMVALVLVLGFATLYRLRLAHGDFFPPYSSLRADPLGTRLLHDSLLSLPGQRVERWLQPLDRLPATPARTIVLAGLSPERWKQFTTAEVGALDAAVRGGSRLVIGLRPASLSVDTREKKSNDAAGGQKEKSREVKKDEKADPAGSEPEENSGEDFEEKPQLADLAKLWEVTVEERALLGAARRGPLAPAGLPLELRWESDVYFDTAPESAWRTIYRRGSRPVLIERSRGLGSIVIASDSYFLSNEALQRDRSAVLLAWAIGALPQTMFSESHLGIVEDPGVAVLARRYGLGGAFFTLLVLTALFIWRRLALFVPPAEEIPGMVLEYNQTAGLEALLRRSVTTGELPRVCVAEWLPTVRAPDIARVEAVLAAVPKSAAPAAVYNSIVRALRHR